MIWRKVPEAKPGDIINTDLQMRLRHIESVACEMMDKHAEGTDAAELASLVDYLAKIVRKYLETNER